MLPWLIIAFAFIAGVYLVARWWTQATPPQLVRALRLTGAGIGIVLLLFVTLSGRWSWLPAAFLPMLPVLFRLGSINAMRKNARGPRPGQTSEVSTRFLRMQLNHDSGEMTGEVTSGQFEGRELQRMNLGELIELWRECAAEDEQSRLVLENYLDRGHPEWRSVAGAGSREETAGAHSDSPWANTGMSADEACEILGVAANASSEEIEEAYRRVMKNAHPDHGGSDWMAAKVNQAKDVLIGN
ncbi:MAG: DnaJ domain-containing protein [Alphaproteobacteria bacterium]|nr:DnaJ domain-containing protein [Alphaproteobacteria bacterium]